MRRHRTISPPRRFAWLFRFGSVLFGAFLLTSFWLAQFAGPDPRIVVQLIFFSLAFGQTLWWLGTRIGVGDGSLLIAKNVFSTEVIRWEWVAGFQWRHNLRSGGQASERLWVTLDDGQQVATPVVKGRLVLADRDLVVSDAQADSLVAEMERLRNLSRQGLRLQDQRD